MVQGQNYPGTSGGGLGTGYVTGYGHDNPVVNGITNGLAEFSAHPNTPGGNGSTDIWLRVKLTNGGGTIYSCPLQYHIKDNAKCCWFCSEANKHKRISPEDWKLIGTVEQAVYKVDRRALASYIKRGDQLVTRMLNRGVKPEYFTGFTDKIVDLALHGHYDEAAKFYMQFVLDSLKEHWPDNKFRGWRRYLR
jgi:hypothetical protein